MVLYNEEKAFTHFNSIKVRLELRPLFVPGLGNVFQFHKGAIRTLEVERFNTLQENFNSIKVRLERITRRFCRRCGKFQFHKGAIRTV